MAGPIGATLPVRRVVVLEDRAQVERRGRASVPKGPSRLAIEGVAPVAVDKSLSAAPSSDGVRVVAARFVRVPVFERAEADVRGAHDARARVVRRARDEVEVVADVDPLVVVAELVVVVEPDVAVAVVEPDVVTAPVDVAEAPPPPGPLELEAPAPSDRPIASGAPAGETRREDQPAVRSPDHGSGILPEHRSWGG